MNPIGFNDLFDKGDFDKGLSDLRALLEQITESIASTEVVSNKLSQTLGDKLKTRINALSSASANLDAEIKKLRADTEAFKQTAAQTDAVLNQYKKANEELTEKVKKLEEETKKYTNTQKDASKVAGQGGVSFSGLSQSLIGVASGAALVYKGIQILKEQLGEAIKSSIEFAASMKQVEAISRASTSQIQQLTKDAQRLGASTEKTAVQIANTQKELAKLGFTVNEIIASTDGIIDLSTATGEGLAQSATVAASTLRAFGLEATEMTRVVDVMAGSFVRSGLDLEKFRESMKLVAPIARAVNIDIETTTAALSKLADAGLSGSLAGTALRNLFSSMADPTDKLSKFLGYTVTNSQSLIHAFKDLRDRGVDLAQAVQMVDVRARPAFFTILNQIDAIEDLALQYRYLDGEAKNIATTIREELNISLEIANSAFDALRREMVDGFMPAMKDGTDGLTVFIDSIRLMVRAYKDGTLAQDGFFSSAVYYYAKLITTVAPLNILATYLGHVYDAFEKLTGVTIGGEFANREFRYALEDLLISVDSSVSSIEKGTRALETFKVATKTVEEGCDELNTSLQALKIAYPELAELVIKENKGLENNADFLGLVIIKQKEKLKETVSEIKSLDDKEKTVNKLIKAEEEQGNNAENLIKLNRTLTIIQDARATSASLLLEIEKALAKTSKDLADEEERILNQQKLEVAQRQFNIEKLKTIELENKNLFAVLKTEEAYNNYKKSRIDTAKAILNQEIEAIVQSTDNEEIRNVKIQIAREKHLQKIIQLEEDSARELIKIDITQEEYYKNRLDSALGFYRSIGEEQEKYKKTLEAIGKIQIDLGNTLPQKEEETLVILKDVMDWRKKQEKEQELSLKNYINLKKQQKEIEQDVAEKGGLATLEQKDAFIALKEELEDYEELTKKAVVNGLREIGRLSTLIFDNAAQRRENELVSIDNWEQERIKLAGDNQEAISAIEQEAEEKRKKIKIEQAKADKREALFQIAILTAVSIVRAITPFEKIAMAVLGAVQAAVVASKPLPQFAKGTDNAPEGQAIVGEKGREIIWDKQTNTTYLSPDSPTVTYLSKGSVVIPNEKTEKILSAKLDRNELAYDRTTPISKIEKTGIDYNRLGATFERAVTKIPLHQTTFDADGVRHFVKKGNNRTERLNRRYRY